MAALANLSQRLSAIFRKTDKTRGNSNRRRFRAQFENLEQRQLLAVSVFDVDQFEQNIRDYFEDNSVGFAYAINQGGVNVASDGWGDARKPADGHVPFTEDTRMGLASVSKTINATATIKLLQDTPGVGLNSSISPYLPAAWVQHPSIASITFRDLLTHRSGILTGSSGHAQLQQIVSSGVNLVEGDPTIQHGFDYANANFGMLRVLTPYLLGLGNAADDADDPAQFIGDTHVDYVLNNVLGPMGINNTNPGPPAVDQVLNYPFPGNGSPTKYSFNAETVGGGGWWLSADELALFLHGLRTNNDVLTPAVREMMFDGFLGLMNPADGYGFAQGMFGTYYGHGGDTGNLNTAIMDFPNGVQASLLINSNFTGAPYQATALKNAFENAWPEIVIDGTENSDSFLISVNPEDTGAVDIFLNGNLVVTRWIETLDSLTINGLGRRDVLTMTNLPAALQTQIAFNGGIGNDSVLLQILPAGVDLIFNGGVGSDTLHVAHTTRDLDWIQGTVTFDGGAGPGTDTLVVDDLNDFDTSPPPNAKVRTYAVAPTTVARSGVGQIVEYHSVSNLVVHSSNQSNQIDVNSTAVDTDVEINAGSGYDLINLNSTAVGTDVEINAGSGNDVINLNSMAVGSDVEINAGNGNDLIVLGGGNASGNLNGVIQVNPGYGIDELVIDDSNGAIAGDTYVFHANYFQSQFIDVIEWADDQTRPNTIRFLASDHDSTINVRDVLTSVTLDVNGRGGDDDMIVHAVAQAGHLVLNGGSGSDTFTFTPETGNVDAIRGQVIVNGSAGAHDRIVLHDENGTAAPSGRYYRLVDSCSLTNIIGTLDIIAFGSAFGLLTYQGSNVETLEIRGSAGADTFDVRSTAGPILQNGTKVKMYGNGGNDTVVVAGQSQILAAISGELYFDGGAGFDMVNLHDQNDTGNDVYNVAIGLLPQVTKGGFELVHAGVEELTLNANLGNNQINVVPSSIFPGSFVNTAYIINGGTGDDTVTVTASALAHVTVNGGAGNDLVEIVGNSQDNEFVLDGNQIRYGGTTVVFGPTVEHRTLDGGGGLDVLVLAGQAGVNETFHVQASSTPGSGHVLPQPFPRLDFVNLEDVDVRGNPGDRDRLIFAGSDGDNMIDVNPVAQGTAAAPVVHLHQGPNLSLLRLRNYVDVGAALIRGGKGNDTFQVTLMPTQEVFPMRNMQLDGGTQPVGGAGDTLIVNNNANLFQLIGAPPTTPNGRLRFAHATDIIDLIFSDFEQLVL